MARYALVLGGGGVTGVAWLSGMLAGLHEEGVDVTSADLLVGTSAGSVVSAQIAQGLTPVELAEEHLNSGTGEAWTPSSETDLSYLVSVFQKWSQFTEMTPANCAEIGAMALAAKTITEEQFMETFVEVLAPDWPDRDLRVTAVDAESGQWRTWTKADGVDIRRAVASSCAVPGLFPCMTIDGRRYTDGGVRSGTNADVAAGYENILVIAPLGARPFGFDVLLGKQAKAEVAALAQSGAQVELVFPDAETLEVMGMDLMNAELSGPSAKAGMRQGRALSSRLAAWATRPPPS